MRRLNRLLAGYLLTTFLALQSDARAVLEAGNEVIDRHLTDTFEDFHILDRNNPFQISGLVTQWEVYVMDSSQLALVLYRDIGDGFDVVGRSELQSTVEGFNRFTLTNPISVNAGDFVGLYLTAAHSAAYTLDPPFRLSARADFRHAVLFTDDQTGAEGATDFVGSTTRTYSVRAFGIVPEPSAWALVAIGASAVAISRFSGGGRRYPTSVPQTAEVECRLISS